MANNEQKKVEAKGKYIKFGFIGFCLLVVVIIAYAIFYMVNSGKYVASIYDVNTKKVVAKIPREEFGYMFNLQKQQVLQYYGSSIDFSGYAENTRLIALEAVKDLEIELIKARDEGIKLDSGIRKKADGIYNNFISSFGNISKSEIESKTKQVYGITLAQLKDIYTKSALVNALKDKEKSNKAEWDKAVKDFYDKNPDLFKKSNYRQTGEEAVWVRHILVKTIDESGNALSAEDAKKAEQKANDILNKAKKGEEFIKLVAENSEDFGSAAYGGDYIFAKAAGMDPTFEAASFALKPGEISGLVKSSSGYHIIKLEEKIPQGKPVSFKAANEYREYIVSDMAYQNKVNGWAKNYDVKKNDQVYNEYK